MQPDPGALVSVIVPAFNAARTICSALYSALSQTHRHIEVIVCDDGSRDETALVVRSLVDSRVRLISHSRNSGAGMARDSAIAVASGEWIALLDADDEWHPSRISELLTVARPGEIVFDDLILCHDRPKMRPIRRVHGEHAFGGKGGEARAVPLANYINSKRLLIQPLIHAETMRATGVHHSTRRFGEDAEFVISLCLAGMQLKYLPLAHYYYRLTPGSLTTDRSARGEMRSLMEQIRGIDELPDDVRAALDTKIRRLALDEHAYDAADCLARGNISGFLRALRAHPAIFLKIMERLPLRLHYEITRVIARTQAR